ncbi:MAG: nuclear transport factor 2 family protein [Candidatus Acidiferrales bacterium]
MTREEMIRNYYAGWERKDWKVIESLLAGSFTFTSPNGDDHIDLPAFHAKCWLGQVDFIDTFELESIAANDRQAFVRYLCRTSRGTSLRNVEVFHFAEEKIDAIECYFGGEHGYPSKSAAHA